MFSLEQYRNIRQEAPDAGIHFCTYWYIKSLTFDVSHLQGRNYTAVTDPAMQGEGRGPRRLKRGIV